MSAWFCRSRFTCRSRERAYHRSRLCDKSLGLWCVVCSLVMFLLPGVGAAAAKDKGCAKLFEEKLFAKAATCFLRSAGAIRGVSGKLGMVKRLLKGRRLRSAIVSFQQAASQSKRVEVAAFFREQALGAARRYLAQELCVKAYRCRQMRVLSRKLKERIGYAQMTLYTGSTRARIKVSGYRYHATHQSPPLWVRSVRPGPYSVRVQFPGKKPITRRVRISPGKPRVMQFVSPPVLATIRRGTQAPARKTPGRPYKPDVLMWVLAGGGSAMLVGGGFMCGFGYASLFKRNALLQERSALLEEIEQKLTAQGKKKPSYINFRIVEVREINQRVLQEHERAGTLLLVGWVLAGVGVAALVGVGVRLLWRVPAGDKRQKTRGNPVVSGRRGRSCIGGHQFGAFR